MTTRWLSDLEQVGTTAESDSVLSVGGLPVLWHGAAQVPVFVRRFADGAVGEIFLSREDVLRRPRWPDFLRSAEGLSPIERLGMADCRLGVVTIGHVPVPWPHVRDTECVYVRRSLRDLSVVQIRLARHDGLADELLIAQVQEAERYPLGPAAYWRSA